MFKSNNFNNQISIPVNLLGLLRMYELVAQISTGNLQFAKYTDVPFRMKRFLVSYHGNRH